MVFYIKRVPPSDDLVGVENHHSSLRKSMCLSGKWRVVYYQYRFIDFLLEWYRNIYSLQNFGLVLKSLNSLSKCKIFLGTFNYYYYYYHDY